ncbi:hypothetical protein CEXT_807471 [Caerostris extrusa]|uniref:Uncharacterized protein n=1 Tax=Caerostris extrusa TaxID=172846 RepID=A0AAV4T265_CAEEX|nr:hypothetical protein CEXT_807471 [Caerostris extrusa]
MATSDSIIQERFRVLPSAQRFKAPFTTAIGEQLRLASTSFDANFGNRFFRVVSLMDISLQFLILKSAHPESEREKFELQKCRWGKIEKAEIYTCWETGGRISTICIFMVIRWASGESSTSSFIFS